MEKIVNLGIPHVAEQIFESTETDDLVQLREVSQTWKVLAENVLLKRWEGQIFGACEAGKTQIVKLLLEHYVPEESGLTNTVRGLNPLMIACLKGHKDVVQLLLDQMYYFDIDIGIEATNDEGHTAFMLACLNGSKDIVKLLLRYLDDDDVDIENTVDGRTAFIMACALGHKEVVKLLLKCETINLNATSMDGEMTGLMFACKEGHKDVVELLLRHFRVILESASFTLDIDDIDVNRRSYPEEKTAFMYACEQGHSDVVDLLLNQSHKKIDFNGRDFNGQTPFELTKAEDKCVVRLLLKHAKAKGIEIPPWVQEPRGHQPHWPQHTPWFWPFRASVAGGRGGRRSRRGRGRH